MNYRILLADDDSLFLGAFKLLLSQNGYRVDTAASANEAYSLIREHGREYALAVIDYHLGDADGVEVIQQIKSIQPQLYILVHSGDPSRQILKDTFQAGAIGFIEKDGISIEEYLSTVKSWCHKFEETQRTLSNFEQLNSTEQAFIPSLKMVGVSKAMRELAAKVERYKNTNKNILILGETGTGKELVAQSLHLGPSNSFYVVNCAAYKNNSDLLESELFGYVKGAFTGAAADKKGILELCEGGTLFLDEIHHLSLGAQAKLLRVLQEKKIRRVGGANETPVAFRLLAASKPDLERLANEGQFLIDLFHRLNVLSVEIPPLRNRREDIEPLISYFSGRAVSDSFSPKKFLMRTIKQLKNYSWPGNVRELENTIERLCLDCEGDTVTPDQLDAKFFGGETVLSPLASYQELKDRQAKEEKEYIEGALREAKTKMDAAVRLNVSPSTLHSIMKRHGLYTSS